jgi:rare lipoprotein A
LTTVTWKAALGAAVILCSFSFHETAGARTGKGTLGIASWYGGTFHGKTTANGERYDMNGLTAAHRSLPFGSKVRITNPATDDSIIVRINDRGPYVGNRVIDLSRAAARAVRIIDRGVAPVRLEVLRNAG